MNEVYVVTTGDFKPNKNTGFSPGYVIAVCSDLDGAIYRATGGYINEDDDWKLEYENDHKEHYLYLNKSEYKFAEIERFTIE